MTKSNGYMCKSQPLRPTLLSNSSVDTREFIPIMISALETAEVAQGAGGRLLVVHHRHPVEEIPISEVVLVLEFVLGEGHNCTLASERCSCRLRM